VTNSEIVYRYFRKGEAFGPDRYMRSVKFNKFACSDYKYAKKFDGKKIRCIKEYKYFETMEMSL
jgi:hypothetical protein